MKYIFTLLFFSLLSCISWGQSSLFFRNNTGNDFHVEVSITSNLNAPDSNWILLEDTVLAWKETDTEVLQCLRDSNHFNPGDSLILRVLFKSISDSTLVLFRIIGNDLGSNFSYRVICPGYDEGWLSDANFHEAALTYNQQAAHLKYKPDNDDSGFSRDIRVTIHDDQPLAIANSDFNNPNVLNIMCYNVQMITFGVSGLGDAALRCDLLPSHFNSNLDAIAFEEIFDDSPRNDHMIPAMEAQGFTYHTSILNDPGLIPFPINGGVMIFSKWPILDSDEIEYAECGPTSSDCLARKGVKYAKINKLGKNYHFFATHMDAGSDAEDMAARHSQVDEINQFILTKNIPSWEPVIFGGDLNTRPYGDDGVFQHFEDSIHFIYPPQRGFYESNFSLDTGRFIDHIWISSQHLLPISAVDKALTYTSIADEMWDLSQFSDHRAMYGRFEFPDVQFSNFTDTNLCPGDSFSAFISSSNNPFLNWTKDGVPLNLTGGNLTLINSTPSESGLYVCQLDYPYTNGPNSYFLDPFFYPGGETIYNSQSGIPIAQLTIDSAFCESGITDWIPNSIKIYPNPSEGDFYINAPENGITTWTIYSFDGKECLSGSINSTLPTLQTTKLENGIYLLELIQNGNSYFQKILIRKG